MINYVIEMIRKYSRKMAYIMPLTLVVTVLLLLLWNSVDLFCTGIVLFLLWLVFFGLSTGGQFKNRIRKVCAELLYAIPISVFVVITGIAACTGGYCAAISAIFGVFKRTAITAGTLLLILWAGCLLVSKRRVFQ